MASFNGASFKEGPASEFAHPSAKAAYTLRTAAGGGQVVDFSGQIERSVSVTALCTAAEVTALRGKVGSTGTLALGAGSYGACLLEAVGKPSEVLISGTYRVALRFLVGVTSTQTIAVTVMIGGTRAAGVLSLSTSAGKTQPVSTAQINCTSKPSGSEGDAVAIYASVDGGGAVALYQGRVERFSWDYYPNTCTVACKGKLALLSLPWGSEVERVYSESAGNSDDAAIIRNLIEAWGYRSSDANIESSGWTLGSIQEVVVKQGDVFADWIGRIDEIAGYLTYDDGADGGIYRRQRQPVGAGGSAVATLTQGVNILRIARQQDVSQLANHAIVEGLSYEGVPVKQEYKATSSILDAVAPGTAPNYRPVTLKSDLIETDAKALEVATRTVGERNRRGDTLDVTTTLNPAITPGVSVTVVAPSVGANGLFVVDQVKHSVDGEKGITSFTTNSGNLS